MTQQLEFAETGDPQYPHKAKLLMETGHLQDERFIPPSVAVPQPYVKVDIWRGPLDPERRVHTFYENTIPVTTRPQDRMLFAPYNYREELQRADVPDTPRGWVSGSVDIYTLAYGLRTTVFFPNEPDDLQGLIVNTRGYTSEGSTRRRLTSQGYVKELTSPDLGFPEEAFTSTRMPQVVFPLLVPFEIGTRGLTNIIDSFTDRHPAGEIGSILRMNNPRPDVKK